ncbi:AzlC family ABC transporter permease [Xylophilus sp. ASV27]|uniref:AzlC family ABC transporter permease n=1 Tax=Xylophilus sp. ASV27 TaxID=2795129 RepID=UPI0018EDD93D|nr:AzlC family ABC transporter permease [Xylophilus sp. ASV27]
MTLDGGLRRVAALTREPEFRRGIADMAGMSVGVGAWGLVTGVAMVKSGMPPGVAVLMSLLVYAGSAQLVVVPLMAAGSPLWVVWLTACCVNLRFVIFSTMWRGYFGGFNRLRRCLIGYFSGDVVFVLFQQRFPELRPRPEQLPYFIGATAINWCSWQLMSILGIVLANVVPVHWGLGFAGVLALLGVLLSMLSDRIAWLAAGVAGAAAVAAFALPLRLNILVGIAAAVAVGLVLEAAFPRHSRIRG